jgi:iron complex transport system substrate-binding protein
VASSDHSSTAHRCAAVGVLAALLALATPVAWQVTAASRTVVDAAGRTVPVPDRIERVFPAGGPASILLYTLVPDRLLGWTRALGVEEQALLPARHAALPGLGRLTGRGNTANVEIVLAARPDLIVDYGAVAPTYAALADRVQQQTGIPYLLLDGGLDAIPRTYQLLGDILGVPGRAGDLARYAAGVLADVDARLARVPVEQRPRVYHGRGPRGLETGTAGAINVESLERLGARNVATGLGQAGIVNVSLEQVLAWDPAVIITIDRTFRAAVATDPRWSGVRAVRDGRVHLAPLLPFPWIDFPPSVNRLIGLPWLGHVLYPGVFTGDLRQEARRFYTLFYHRSPDERQLEALLGAPGKARP